MAELRRTRIRSSFGTVLALGALSAAVACGPEAAPADPGGSDDGTGGGTAASGGAGVSGASQTGGVSGSTGGTTAGSSGTTGGVTSGGTGGTTLGGTGGTTLGGTGGAPLGGASGTGPSGGVATGGLSGNGGSGGVAGVSGGGGRGGASGAGGASGGSMTGGTGGTGGGGKSGLPAPPTTGVPKPSGTPNGIRVLNWAGFKGAVSYTFDDSNSSQIQNYSALKALGVRMTFYLQTGKTTESSNPVWATAVTDGHELGNHTKSHLTNGTGQDVDEATTFIESRFGVKVWTMAAPNGGAVYTDLAKTRFLINRGVSNSLILANGTADPFTLPCFIPATGASAATMNAQIDSAQSGSGWRVVLVHGFSGGSDGAYQPVALSEFVASVNHAKSLGDMWIDSVVNVGAYWRAQKLVSALTPTTSGSDRTWSWTLPDHFPPGMYLRVAVDGGTLRQGSTTLAWDSHGYYEVALDARSVTLGP